MQMNFNKFVDSVNFVLSINHSKIKFVKNILLVPHTQICQLLPILKCTLF